MRQIANPTATRADFNAPGHTQPLTAKEGGLATRIGHTEAAVDLARLVGSEPAAVIIEVLKEDAPETVHMMLREAAGLMCTPVGPEIAERLGFTDMVAESTDPHQTPFTYTVDGTFEATGVTTGVSAMDRNSLSVSLVV
ncbi:3,4-dihydroxy-2-butanone-4-phosphate synthase [Weissella confusa]|uniref:3,4-dihydroxy-2-butanone-4-phosphate synthase n=1 Tax=Weissella confusa TaxID=1583 RepID=A0A923NF27_WEICO|nr:3,4-dihydroxy-2-butanone-4-phosphate synthase [Weissella confusa]